MANIKKYFPPIYDGFTEIDVLSDIQNKQFTDFEKEINNFVMNQFVATCSIEKLEELERILKIHIKNESIEFRRNIILNRLYMSGPYTLPFLREKLDSIIGKDKYTINIDYSNYTLYVESSAINQEWFYETYVTIHQIKPANIVFINKPRILDNLLLNETIEYKKILYKYKVGSWQLDELPFAIDGGNEMLKEKEEKSISNFTIEYLKNCFLEKIDHILINDDLKINNFTYMGLYEDVIKIEYNINETMGINKINKIDIYDNTGNILSTTKVDVQVIEGMEMKHIFNLFEGGLINE